MATVPFHATAVAGRPCPADRGRASVAVLGLGDVRAASPVQALCSHDPDTEFAFHVARTRNGLTTALAASRCLRCREPIIGIDANGDGNPPHGWMTTAEYARRRVPPSRNSLI
ncbi:hypothetical protein [Fodinicola feengrottensis]|uniref:Uncharacterized protein n=1 Tax=Fodinicola feengrottensis TaxID=435914 RepID=A0ABP4RMD7_9ACTN|nr:hypothetical protein [Fodinicola feengrottensis]